MPSLASLCDYLEQFAPSTLAESWDNVGLLVGDREADVTSVMTCLTVTPTSAAEAIEGSVNLIVTHHPLPFHALKRLTTDSTPGRLLWQLMGHRIAVYSPHTSFDSAGGGINQQLANGLGLERTAPLVAIEGVEPPLGSGRHGQLDQPSTLMGMAKRLKSFLKIQHLQSVGPPEQPIRRVAVACGAAGQLLEAARHAKCDLLVTGETNLHTCLEAEATEMAMLLPGHFASERFAVEQLARVLAAQFPELTVWASKRESDPLRWC